MASHSENQSISGQPLWPLPLRCRSSPRAPPLWLARGYAQGRFIDRNRMYCELIVADRLVFLFSLVNACGYVRCRKDELDGGQIGDYPRGGLGTTLEILFSAVVR